MNTNNFPNSTTLKHWQNGASLIEVLIAVLILSVGMLGMASLQTRAMQFNQSAYYQSQTGVLAQDIFDRMRASNDGTATLNQFSHGMEDSIPGSYTSCYGVSDSTSCTPAQMAQYDLYSWLTDVSVLLPNGKAQIEVDNSGVSPIYIVTIQYSDSRVDASTKHGQTNTIPPKQFSFRTEL
jgi:type IV pilus assembly protein PilV